MPFKVLALGAGVQSSAVLLLSAKGILPKLDAAVFADTGWEPPAVYQTLEWLKAEAGRAGIPVHIVSAGNIRDDSLDPAKPLTMPVFVTKPDGGKTRWQRLCTQQYKIQPVSAFLRRDILGIRHRERSPTSSEVDLWMGISADEAGRMKMSIEPWKRNVYPLCGVPEDMLASPWHRQDCLDWMAREYPGRAVAKSACIGCPYHGDEEWRRIRERPEEWAQALEMDRAIRDRNRRAGSQVYLHKALIPLEEVALGSAPNQLGEECDGLCGN